MTRTTGPLMAAAAMAGAAWLSLAPAAADDNAERLARLDPEQRAFAEDVQAFIDSMDAKYFGRASAINGGEQSEETRDFDTEYSLHKVRVARGPVIAKIGRMESRGKKASPGRGEGELVWSRFYSIDVHPATPLVGMLHATIVVQFYADGSVGTGGWLDVMPGTRIEEDIARWGKVVDDHFTAAGKDPALYRELVCKGTEETISEFRRKPSCAGVSFYGPPVFRDDPRASYDFISGLYDKFVGTYLDIVEDRQDDPFTAEDVAAQDAMRRQWLIDQLFSDPFASAIVPFEVWSMANVAPVVKF